MALAAVSLEDKYTLESGRVYLNGTQALVRLPMMQRQRDARAGLNTGCFISGYRGSPLGALDQQLWQARRFLKSNHIHFQPGVNEDLAATAIWGSQQGGLFGDSDYDGVFAMWYAKGPGADRSGDVLKHGNSAGSAPHGGVLLLAGDDHTAKSSTLAHQCEHTFADAMIPVLNPAGVQEFLDLGLYGWAMSRYSGCWVGFKTIGETVDSSASVYVDPARIQIATPEDFEMPEGGLNIRWPDTPWSRKTACTATRSMPPSPSHGPTSSTAWSWIRPSGASGSSPPASPISTCAKRSTISASTRPARPSSVSGSTRPAWSGRWSGAARGPSPTGWRRSWSSRRSAR